LRLLRQENRKFSVLSLCKLHLAFGRALKTTNPAALAPFAAGTTGAGLDDADSSQTGSTSGIGYPSPTVGRAARNFWLTAPRKRRTSLLPGASRRSITA
jgi:hypothetical protein